MPSRPPESCSVDRALGAVEGLDLALLVHRQDQRLVRRIEVEADHVLHFLRERRRPLLGMGDPKVMRVDPLIGRLQFVRAHVPFELAAVQGSQAPALVRVRARRPVSG